MTKKTIRRLRPDEPIPNGTPHRYRSANGYIRLRWQLSATELVETYEHRVVAGRDAEHVHHINGVKDDNRPENLKPVSVREHSNEHAKVDIQELTRLYDGGLSTPAIARMFDMDPSVVYRRLRLHGIKTRNLTEAWKFRSDYKGPKVSDVQSEAALAD